VELLWENFHVQVSRSKLNVYELITVVCIQLGVVRHTIHHGSVLIISGVESQDSVFSQDSLESFLVSWSWSWSRGLVFFGHGLGLEGWCFGHGLGLEGWCFGHGLGLEGWCFGHGLGLESWCFGLGLEGWCLSHGLGLEGWYFFLCLGLFEGRCLGLEGWCFGWSWSRS